MSGSVMMDKEIEAMQTLTEEIDLSKAVQVPPLEMGDIFPQGDIALTMIKSLPSKKTPVSWAGGDMQLAPGTTRGSRHCIPGKFSSDVSIYRINDGDVLSDLVLEARAPFDLTHPEHADHLGYLAGFYRVVHQQNEQRQRILD